MLWKIRITSAPGFSSCQSALMTGAWVHMVATSSVMQIWRLAHVTQLLIFQSYFICAPPISLVPTASPAASKLGRGASPQKTHPASGFPVCQYRRCGKTHPVQSPCLVFLVYLTALIYTTVQCGIDEADEGEVSQQDHMSAHHLTPSAVASEL